VQNDRIKYFTINFNCSDMKYPGVESGPLTANWTYLTLLLKSFNVIFQVYFWPFKLSTPFCVWQFVLILQIHVHLSISLKSVHKWHNWWQPDTTINLHLNVWYSPLSVKHVLTHHTLIKSTYYLSTSLLDHCYALSWNSSFKI
jgi:hypothetical protein